MKKGVEVGGRLGRTTKSGQKFHCATQRLEKLCRADYNCLLVTSVFERWETAFPVQRCVFCASAG